MRANITIIHIESGEVVSTHNTIADYKPHHATTYQGTDVIHYSDYMFLVGFDVEVIKQGDFICIGNVSVTTNTLTETLKSYESYEVKSADEVESKYGVNYKYKVMAQ